MHEKERHRIILSAVQEKPVVTVQELVDLTDTFGGDDPARYRGAARAEAAAPRARRRRGDCIRRSSSASPGGPSRVNETINAAQKRAIAREAVELCEDGEPIIINGGTTTFQMVHFLTNRRMQVFTNSFPIAEHLLQAFQEHGDAVGRHDLSRAEHHPVARSTTT